MGRALSDEHALRGRIEVIVGPMFSGKTEALIQRLKLASDLGHRTKAFKPRLDDRYHASDLVSHNAVRIKAEAIDSVAPIMACPAPVVGVDEIQFFDPSVVAVLEALADRGTRVIVAGLDLDHRGQPFGVVPSLMARAELVSKLSARCAQCGELASRTRRLDRSQDLIRVGAEDQYQPVCRRCFRKEGH